MLGKLLKHELRATSRVMLPFFGVLLALSVVSIFSFKYMGVVDNWFINLLLGLFAAAFFVGIMAIAVLALAVMVERFYKNLLGGEGYLMFTLPTGVHSLVWSKLLASLLWFLLTGIVVLLAICILVFAVNSVDLGELFRSLPSLGELFEALQSQAGISPGQFVLLGIEFLLLLAAAGLCSCLFFYAAMAMGHCFSNRKVFWSVIFFLGLGFVFQIFSVLFMMFIGHAEYSYFLSAADAAELISRFMLYFLGFELFQGGILYAATTLSLKKGLNLA